MDFRYLTRTTISTLCFKRTNLELQKNIDVTMTIDIENYKSIIGDDQLVGSKNYRRLLPILLQGRVHYCDYSDKELI